MNLAAKMHPALQRRMQEQERLLDVARRYARRVAERVAVRWAVVAGSVARGDFHDGSDIDVLVVSDALPPQPLRRAEVLFGVAFGGVEPKGLTSGEVRSGIPGLRQIKPGPRLSGRMSAAPSFPRLAGGDPGD